MTDASEELTSLRALLAKAAEAMEQVRTLAIPAGAAFVRSNPDRHERATKVLDIIDAALAEIRRATQEPRHD